MPHTVVVLLLLTLCCWGRTDALAAPGNRGGQGKTSVGLPKVYAKQSAIIRSRVNRRGKHTQDIGTAPRLHKQMKHLYAKARVAQKELREITKEMSEAIGGRALFSGGRGLKGVKRARQKVRQELAGDATRLTDISRATMVFGSLEQMYAGLTFIAGKGGKFDHQLIEVRDRFVNPRPTGYRDILLKLRMSNGHIAELQLNVEPMLKAKKVEEKQRLYQKIRTATSELAAKAALAEANLIYLSRFQKLLAEPAAK